MSSTHISRRTFLATVPAWAASLALLKGGLLQAASPQPRVGCQANGFPLKAGDFPALLAALEKMRALGYVGFECNIRFLQGEFDHTSEARKQIEDTGVTFISVHTSLALAKPEVFPGWVDHVAALGGSCIVISGAGPADATSGRPEWLKKAAALDNLGRQCRAGGLHLAYHNHNPEFANHNAQIDVLAEATDPKLVDFLMDAGHAHLGGGDPAAFMTRHAPRIYGCHLKTFHGDQKHQVGLGHGDWGFEDLAAAVRATSWAGWLLTEEGGMPEAPGTASLGPDREYIRRVFGV